MLQISCPTIKEFKVGTKTGTHSFFELMNTTIAIPKMNEKMVITEATVPTELQSKAVWVNGELKIFIKHLGKNSKTPIKF